MHRQSEKDSVDLTPLLCQVSLELIRGDLVSPILPRLSGSIDVLVFNPPYVPTESEEIQGNGIAVSWAGGKDGMEVTSRLLPLVEVGTNWIGSL
jgi:release factor glutamine methyltransferase